jgi:uncharacterized membrane protein
MAKQQQQNKLAKNGKGELMVEQNLAYDDSLLPNAAELEKLKEVDTKIIDWILSRTEIEQDARIKYNQDRMTLTDYDLRKIHRFNITSLIFGFIIFIVVLALAGFFIFKGLNIEGTLFGGTAIIGGAIFFIKAAAASKTDKNK